MSLQEFSFSKRWTFIKQKKHVVLCLFSSLENQAAFSSGHIDAEFVRPISNDNSADSSR